MAYTQGDWRYVATGQDIDHTNTHSSLIETGELFFYIKNSKETPLHEVKANAKLIAAAPDMLITLKRVKNAIDANFSDEVKNELAIAIESIDLAIKKATE